METLKTRRDDRLAQLRLAARQLDPAALAAVELISIMLRQVKDRLVDVVDRDELLRVQGGGRLLDRLYKDLTTEPVNIKPPVDNQEK